MEPLERAALFEPSLNRDGPAAMPYSPGSLFWMAFLGGPLAVSIWFGLNARRLGRWKEDLLWTIGAMAVALALLVGGILAPILLPELFDWMVGRNRRFVLRGCGLVGWAVLRWRHARWLKASELSAQEHPSPWGPGILVLLLTNAISIGVAYLVLVSFEGGE